MCDSYVNYYFTSQMSMQESGQELQKKYKTYLDILNFYQMAKKEGDQRKQMDYSQKKDEIEQELDELISNIDECKEMV